MIRDLHLYSLVFLHFSHSFFTAFDTTKFSQSLTYNLYYANNKVSRHRTCPPPNVPLADELPIAIEALYVWFHSLLKTKAT